QRRGEIERDDLRDPLSPLCPAARAPPNDRRDCPPAVPPDRENPASGRPVQGTRPSPEPKVQATPDGQNDPRTPKLRLSGRPGQRPVDGCSPVAPGIFDPATGIFDPESAALCLVIDNSTANPTVVIRSVSERWSRHHGGHPDDYDSTPRV